MVALARACRPLHRAAGRCAPVAQQQHRVPPPSPRRGCTRLQASAAGAACSDEQASALFATLWQAAGALPATPPVALAQTALGRGLVVRAGCVLAAGELVISLPWAAVLSVSDGETADGPADARLACALLAATAADSDNALWRQYAAMLPSGTGAAALWRSDAVDELQSPSAVDAAHGARLHFRAQAARMRTPSQRDALWALSMVHSRSFAVPVPGQGLLRVLAPLADLVNNEQPCAAEVAGGTEESPWRAADGRFELRAARRFGPGEEVLMFYGHETSAELLISYGFAPVPNSAAYVPLYTDLRELLDDDRWTAREPARVTRAKATLLYGGDAAQAPLAVRPGGVAAAAHLLGCLRVVHAAAEDVALLEQRLDAAVGHATWQWRTTASEEAAARCARADATALEHAAGRALEALEDMPTTLEEDEQLLAQLSEEAEVVRITSEAADDDEERDAAAALLAAVRFRLGVKRLLQQFASEASGGVR